MFVKQTTNSIRAIDVMTMLSKPIDMSAVSMSSHIVGILRYIINETNKISDKSDASIRTKLKSTQYFCSVSQYSFL